MSAKPKKKQAQENHDSPTIVSTIEPIAVESLIPYAQNAKMHSKEQVGKIAGSIRKFGFNNPILIDEDNGIIAGHGRVLAAEKLGMTEVPCIRLAHLDEIQKRAYILADNRLSEIGGGWDEEMLKLEVEELTALGEDLGDCGFDVDEILGGDQPGDNPDKSPKENYWPSLVAQGDLVELVSPSGTRHRLLCGDSTKQPEVDRLMDGRKIQLLHTDPPYGVSYESDVHGSIKNDELRGNDLLKNLITPALKCAVAVGKEDTAYYIWHVSSTRDEFAWAMKAAGLQERQYIIWVKPSFVLGHADYHWGHEPAFYAGTFGNRPRFLGDRKNSTVWRVTKCNDGMIDVREGVVITDGESNLYIKTTAPKNQKRVIRIDGPVQITDGESDAWEIATDDRKDYIHPTQKPCEIALRAIQNHCEKGDAVLDLFTGSGSTLIAAEMAGAHGYGMELDPKFCDAIAARWLRSYAKGSVLINGEDVSDKYQTNEPE
jgi:DNA modification methylase